MKEEIEDGKKKGMWKYTPGKKVMDAGKKPVDVLLYKDGDTIPEKEAKHGGPWGYAPGAKPDSKGNYSPTDLWCFANGETPPSDDEWQPQGTWVPKELPKEKTPTSPKKANGSDQPVVGPNTRSRRLVGSAWVFPSPKYAPPGERNNLQGVWATPPGDGSAGKTYKEGEPMEVMIHPPGKEPSESELKKTACGKWGYVKGRRPPNKDDVVDPKDIIFFPPGVDPGPDTDVEGVWSAPGARIEESISWKFVGSDIQHFKKTEIFFMDTVTTFTHEFVKKA